LSAARCHADSLHLGTLVGGPWCQRSRGRPETWCSSHALLASGTAQSVADAARDGLLSLARGTHWSEASCSRVWRTAPTTLRGGPAGNPVGFDGDVASNQAIKLVPVCSVTWSQPKSSVGLHHRRVGGESRERIRRREIFHCTAGDFPQRRASALRECRRESPATAIGCVDRRSSGNFTPTTTTSSDPPHAAAAVAMSRSPVWPLCVFHVLVRVY
jgi:hypothetical protein